MLVKKTIVKSTKNQLPNVTLDSGPTSKGADNHRKISCKDHDEQFYAGSSPLDEIAPSQKLSELQLSHQFYLYWDNRMEIYEGRIRRQSELL
jgi:hypothetical protein